MCSKLMFSSSLALCPYDTRDNMEKVHIGISFGQFEDMIAPMNKILVKEKPFTAKKNTLS